MQIEALELSRRKLLAAAGATVAASLFHIDEAAAGPAPGGSAATAPAVHGLHLQFGADASAQMVVSWHTLQPVRRARVVLGHLDVTHERTIAAMETMYTDAKSNQVLYAYHAKLGDLRAGAAYMYAAMHDGAEPGFGTFRMLARGRTPFTFTSFGDQGTPTVGKRYVPPAGVTIPNPPYVNDNLGAPAGGDTTLGVERLRPAFHLFNGDLCYANIATDRVRTWWDFGPTIAVARAIARGCRHPATMKTNSGTGPSVIGSKREHDGIDRHHRTIVALLQRVVQRKKRCCRRRIHR